MSVSIKIGEYIAVKSNEEYIDLYNMRLFEKIDGGKIICWNNSETKLLEYDFYQEFPSDNRHPFTDCWKNAKGEVVTWEYMENSNVFKGITLVSDSGIKQDENKEYPIDTWKDSQGNLVCYISDVEKIKVE